MNNDKKFTWLLWADQYQMPNTDIKWYLALSSYPSSFFVVFGSYQVVAAIIERYAVQTSFIFDLLGISFTIKMSCVVSEARVATEMPLHNVFYFNVTGSHKSTHCQCFILTMLRPQLTKLSLHFVLCKHVFYG